MASRARRLRRPAYGRQDLTRVHLGCRSGPETVSRSTTCSRIFAFLSSRATRARLSHGHAQRNGRFAREFSFHFEAHAYLFVESHLSETACRKRAGIDVPRTGLGTVPRTVPGVTLMGICRWTSSAILRPVCAATAGPYRKVTCGQILAAIANPTCRSIRIATRKLICGAICGGACSGTCVATSAASCR